MTKSGAFTIPNPLGAGNVKDADLRFGVVSQIRVSQGAAIDLVDQRRCEDVMPWESDHQWVDGR